MEKRGRMFMGRYEVRSLLGEGGMGKVYLAYQYDLKRHVVVKVMHDHIACDPKFRERFESETLLMAQFQHPYAVTLHDASLNDPEGPCIVMEYVRGVTLEQMLAQNQGRLGPARVGRLLGQLCEVLQAAHTQGIIHRDLKPANIMIVDADSPYEKIKVMDFGLAKLRERPSLRQAVDGGNEFAVGTPTYMCPEQVRGEEMDQRGDLYSVGVMLFEMLTGRLPFASEEAMDILLAHATESAPRFADLGVDWIPPAIEDVVISCLAKDPDDRPSSARDLAERYQDALEHGHRDRPAADEPAKDKGGTTEIVAHPSAFIDPTAVVHHLEAWMPETIAVYKLMGFVQDAGGEVVESEPGRVRVRLGKTGGAYTVKGGPLSWIGIGRKPSLLEMELRFEQADKNRPGLLSITVIMRSLSGEVPSNPLWLSRCNQIFIDLRGYLMGKGGGTGE